MKAIYAFLITLIVAVTAVTVRAYACSDDEISGGYCFDGGPIDSRGPYYGCNMIDGSNICDTWHGYGSEAAWNTAQDMIAGRPKDPGANCWIRDGGGVGDWYCCPEYGGGSCCSRMENGVERRVCQRWFDLIWTGFGLYCQYIGANPVPTCQLTQ